MERHEGLVQGGDVSNAGIDFARLAAILSHSTGVALGMSAFTASLTSGMPSRGTIPRPPVSPWEPRGGQSQGALPSGHAARSVIGENADAVKVKVLRQLGAVSQRCLVSS